MNHFQPSFSCQTDGLTLDSRILWNTGKFIVAMTAKCPGPVITKQAQIINLSSQCLTAGMRCFCWYAGFGFFAKHLHFGLFCPNNIVPGVLWFVQMQLCKLKLCCHVLFLERKGFFLTTRQKQAILAQGFSDYTATNVYLLHANWDDTCFLFFFKFLWAYEGGND